MVIIHKNRFLKYGIALLIVASVSLFFDANTSKAGFQRQTIPTAPPPTDTTYPTSESSGTPTSPVRPTNAPTQQNTEVLSPTRGVTANVTPLGGIASPSEAPSSTATMGGGTIPLLTETSSEGEGRLNTPTSSTIGTATGAPGAKSGGGSGAWFYIIGGGVAIGAVVGAVWWLKRRRS